MKRVGVMTPRSNLTRAFSIVEVLVAMAVLTFGVYAIYEQFITLRRLGDQRQPVHQARWLAHQQLEELRAAPAAALRRWTPPAQPQAVFNHGRFVQRGAVHEREDGLLQITVRVGWGESGTEGFAEGYYVEAMGVKTP